MSGACSHSVGILSPTATGTDSLELTGTDSNWLTQTVCGTWLYNCLTFTCLLWAYASAPNLTTSTGQGDIPMFSTGCTSFAVTQVYLLIDGSVEGQYVTHGHQVWTNGSSGLLRSFGEILVDSLVSTKELFSLYISVAILAYFCYSCSPRPSFNFTSQPVVRGPKVSHHSCYCVILHCIAQIDKRTLHGAFFVSNQDAISFVVLLIQ